MVTIFILCYNEEVLLPHTIQHYKSYLPLCNIVIYDNKSTDNSVKIARSQGCKVISWNSNNEIDDFRYLFIKNNCWKQSSDWVIVCDMDEWLCVTQEELLKEQSKNTVILSVRGYNMIGESKSITLEDIDLHKIKKSVYFPEENKSLCFYRPAIREINYNLGAHICNPSLITDGLYSKKIYINKHMNYLGLPFFMEKMLERYKRSARMRSKKFAYHYINDIQKIKDLYLYQLSISSDLKN
uniref:Glycosyltransferase 2-like domain-containing protein n=1 Tax=viral metagenome TaxID=1070528 RepID=A0A6C0HS17_9ZZZZ